MVLSPRRADFAYQTDAFEVISGSEVIDDCEIDLVAKIIPLHLVIWIVLRVRRNPCANPQLW